MYYTNTEIMRATVKQLNEKTDNRFVYAIGLFCLLSICISEFPKATSKAEVKKSEIIVAENNTTAKAEIGLFNNKI